MKRKSVKAILTALLLVLVMGLCACGSSRLLPGSDSTRERDTRDDDDDDEDEDEDEDTRDRDRDKDKDDKDDDDDDWDDDDDDDIDDTDDYSGSALYRTVEDYVNSDEIQSVIDEFDMEGLAMTIRGEGNKMIYSYTYTDPSIADVDMELLASELEKALNEQEQTFIDVADAIKEIVAEMNPIVVVEYLAPDGQLIYSQEFSTSD